MVRIRKWGNASKRGANEVKNCMIAFEYSSPIANFLVLILYFDGNY